MYSIDRRVVITGVGIVSPLGSSPQTLFASLQSGRSGVVTLDDLSPQSFPSCYGSVAAEFTGDIDDFGELERGKKKAIRKGLKVMCREIQMGVAAAQFALADASIQPGTYAPTESGVIFGSDYMVSEPEEFIQGIRCCFSDDNSFDYDRWGEEGMSKITPLWLLKYLPNMPASHIAIYNDLQGPSNSITLRDASSNLSLAEAYCTLSRGRAEMLVAGATGTRIQPMRRVHVATQEQVAINGVDPARSSRPFDRHRSGMVMGEGAGAIVLEDLRRAESRGANIYAEIVGYGSSSVCDPNGVGRCANAVENAIVMALNTAKLKAKDIGHVHAHGLSTRTADAQEAQAIGRSLGHRSDPVPVVAAKSHFGNLGAGSGAVELIASLVAINDGRLFPILNYETPDPDCPINVIKPGDQVHAGNSVLNINFTPQGQASALVARKCA